MLRPHPSPKEIYEEEQDTCPERSPELWDAINKSGHIPRRLKLQCIHKHGLEYDACKFYTYTTYKPRFFTTLMCTYRESLYENKGSGWYYVGKTQNKIKKSWSNLHKT